MYIIQGKKEATNLRKSKDGYMGAVGERKEKWYDYYIYKNKKYIQSKHCITFFCLWKYPMKSW